GPATASPPSPARDRLCRRSPLLDAIRDARPVVAVADQMDAAHRGAALAHRPHARQMTDLGLRRGAHVTEHAREDRLAEATHERRELRARDGHEIGVAPLEDFLATGAADERAEQDVSLGRARLPLAR